MPLILEYVGVCCIERNIAFVIVVDGVVISGVFLLRVCVYVYLYVIGLVFSTTDGLESSHNNIVISYEQIYSILWHTCTHGHTSIQTDMYVDLAMFISGFCIYVPS